MSGGGASGYSKPPALMRMVDEWCCHVVVLLNNGFGVWFVVYHGWFGLLAWRSD